MKILLRCLCLMIVPSIAFSQKWSETKKDNIVIIANKGGQTLDYAITSGLKVLTIDGFAFKDLNKNGKLDKYEDWRISIIAFANACRYERCRKAI